MNTAVVLIESDIKVKDNNSECYIKMGKAEVNTGEFTMEKLMRAGDKWEIPKHLPWVSRCSYPSQEAKIPPQTDHQNPQEFHEPLPN